MKKIIIASLVFLMMGAAVIYADSASFVGRKIQSEAIVTLDGEEIGSVLIIDGVSYAPVRVIAEASGLKAGYKKGEVMLTSEGDNMSAQAVIEENIDADGLTKEKKRLEINADTLRSYISGLTFSISQYESAIKQVDETAASGIQNMLDDAKSKKQAYETELIEVEQRIAEIDNLLK